MRLPSGMRQLLKRPIEEKLKSAIPLHSGDSLLLSLLGKIISRPALALTLSTCSTGFTRPFT